MYRNYIPNGALGKATSLRHISVDRHGAAFERLGKSAFRRVLGLPFCEDEPVYNHYSFITKKNTASLMMASEDQPEGSSALSKMDPLLRHIERLADTDLLPEPLKHYASRVVNEAKDVLREVEINPAVFVGESRAGKSTLLNQMLYHNQRHAAPSAAAGAAEASGATAVISEPVVSVKDTDGGDTDESAKNAVVAYLDHCDREAAYTKAQRKIRDETHKRAALVMQASAEGVANACAVHRRMRQVGPLPSLWGQDQLSSTALPQLVRDSGKAGEWVVNLTMLSQAELDSAKSHMQAMINEELDLGSGSSAIAASQSSAKDDGDSDEEEDGDDAADVQTEEIYLIDNLPDDSESDTETESDDCDAHDMDIDDGASTGTARPAGCYGSKRKSELDRIRRNGCEPPTLARHLAGKTVTFCVSTPSFDDGAKLVHDFLLKMTCDTGRVSKYQEYASPLVTGVEIRVPSNVRPVVDFPGHDVRDGKRRDGMFSRWMAEYQDRMSSLVVMTKRTAGAVMPKLLDTNVLENKLLKPLWAHRNRARAASGSSDGDVNREPDPIAVCFVKVPEKGESVTVPADDELEESAAAARKQLEKEFRPSQWYQKRADSAQDELEMKQLKALTKEIKKNFKTAGIHALGVCPFRRPDSELRELCSIIRKKADHAAGVQRDRAVRNLLEVTYEALRHLTRAQAPLTAAEKDQISKMLRQQNPSELAMELTNALDNVLIEPVHQILEDRLEPAKRVRLASDKSRQFWGSKKEAMKDMSSQQLKACTRMCKTEYAVVHKPLVLDLLLAHALPAARNCQWFLAALKLSVPDIVAQAFEECGFERRLLDTAGVHATDDPSHLPVVQCAMMARSHIIKIVSDSCEMSLDMLRHDNLEFLLRNTVAQKLWCRVAKECGDARKSASRADTDKQLTAMIRVLQKHSKQAREVACNVPDVVESFVRQDVQRAAECAFTTLSTMADGMLRNDSREMARSAREDLHKAFSESVARFESVEMAKFGELQKRIARLDAGPPVEMRQVTKARTAAQIPHVRQGRDKLATMSYQDIKSFCIDYASRNSHTPCKFKGCDKLGCAEHCLAVEFKRCPLKRRCEKERIPVTTAIKGGALQRQTLAKKLYERAVDKAAQAAREQRRPPQGQQSAADALRETRDQNVGAGSHTGSAGMGAAAINRGQKRKSSPTSAPHQCKRRLSERHM